eukprot:156212-Rhodomonas_salina.3
MSGKPINSSMARIATISVIPKHFPPTLADTGDSPCFGHTSSLETSRCSRGTALSCRLEWVLLDMGADVPRLPVCPKPRHACMIPKTVDRLVNMLHPSSDLRLYLQADIVLALHVHVKSAHQFGLHMDALSRQLVVLVPSQPQLRSCN